MCGGAADLDLDGLSVSAEKCKWGTSDTLADSDGDGIKDCVEANDTNGDGVANFPADVINSAKAANGIIQKTLDFDLNGDGVVTFPGDTILSAKMVNHVGGDLLRPAGGHARRTRTDIKRRRCASRTYRRCPASSARRRRSRRCDRLTRRCS